tara:strand:- start:2056 stop:2361 length:306 start_codon:yes stop_codon:yes gene_type:complete
MTKKNQQPSQKISDGQSQAVLSGGFANPGMRLSTIKTMVTSLKVLIQELTGEATRVTVVLTDLTLLLDAVSIRYGDSPIVSIADSMIDEANDLSVDPPINN